MTQSEKQRHNGDEEIIKELCAANGVSYEKVMQDGSVLSCVEMFFSGFPRMVGLSLFPQLSQLVVVGQSVDLIQGLEACPLLQELWVVECQLTEIGGLQSCIHLQKLYLYDNKISRIENLELLENLEVLWLNSNHIAVIEGLSCLRKLRELNLAVNSLETVGHSLDPNINLQNVNLSGNKISSFKEVTYLANLPELKELSLKDPQSPPNPVCLLCNYATHVLYHLPNLQRLDTYDISSKLIKDTVESTVMKKMMYYNMRVRLAQRQLGEMQAQLLDHKKRLQKLPQEYIRVLSCMLKHLECELVEAQASPRKQVQWWEESAEGSDNCYGTSVDVDQDPDREHKIRMKVEALKKRLRLWLWRLEELEAHHQQALALATERKDLMVHFLVMELETVGNIRFEEGCSSDPWFTSCCDLIQSRFCARDYKAHGIVGVKVTRIIRVHNRALRLRFEEKLHTLLTSVEFSLSQNYKRWLEYLFYVPDPQHSNGKNEYLQVPVEGFQSASVYKALGRVGAVPLSNSLSVCDKYRLENMQNQAKADGIKGMQPLPPQQSQVIVAKVFLGISLPVQEGLEIESENYPKTHSVYCSVTADSCLGTKCPRSSNLHGNCECGLRQRQWFVFDHELVLPEYLVDFKYVTQDRGCTSPNEDLPQFTYDITRDEEVLNMEPAIKPQPKILSLDEKTILSLARANVLSQIIVLNLHDNNLSKLKEISCLTSLRRLTISFNDFTHLDDISHMPNLEFVDASYNRISTLEGLRGMVRLQHLDLHWNQLSNAREEATFLRKHAPSLLRLDLRQNPWHRPEEVRLIVLGRLKTLTHLNEQQVTEEEATTAMQMATGSRINQASLRAHSWTETERPRSLSLLPVAQLLTQSRPNPWDLSSGPEPGWTLKITAVNLDSQRLTRLVNLSHLVNLRWASFNNNEISKVEGLESCQHLEELSLNDNCISKLDGASKLHRLTRLSVNGNRLTSLDGAILEKLPNLHFLSAESNCIGSLHGIQCARSLFELYVGNNCIGATRDIYHLKVLTNLIILDLYGNPLVSKQENYRIYVVFHLPSLKALDGMAVEMSERENARDIFGGRLTPDVVAEKMGHSNYSDITNLDLQSSSIRMVDLSPVDLFKNLHTVNLQHNNLTSFSGLIYLPNVKVLYLNHNHIESILPRNKAPVYQTGRQALYHKVTSSGYGQQGPNTASRDPGSGTLEPLMESLEVLHLGYNGISSLAELQLNRFPNLTSLFLQGSNDIRQVDGLEGLQQLQELVLDHNRIKALGEGSFSSQAALLELRLAENRLRELNHLQPLIHLRRLFLDLNKLQDMSEIDKLEELPSLIELSVVGNPVARRSLHRAAVVLRLTELQVLDGVPVTMEERTQAELQCFEAQCSIASTATFDLSVPGLLPLLSRPIPQRGTGLPLGLQHILTSDILLPCHLDETHDTKYRKQRHSSGMAHSRNLQPEVTYRKARATGGVVSTTAFLSNGQRVLLSYPAHQEHDSRSNTATQPEHMSRWLLSRMLTVLLLLLFPGFRTTVLPNHPTCSSTTMEVESKEHEHGEEGRFTAEQHNPSGRQHSDHLLQ
ncbi:leucine-rich repeat-containing protein 9-like [Arapaima gigas]